MKNLNKKIGVLFLIMIISACKFSNDTTNTTDTKTSSTEELFTDVVDSSSASTSEDLSNIVYRKYKGSSVSGASAAWGCHDPRIFQDDDGTYYVYSTGWANGAEVRISSDLIHWTKKGKSPFYASSSVSETYGHMYWDDDFLKWVGYAQNDGTKYSTDTYTATSEPNSWAPAVIKQNGKYYMFHGIITDSQTYADKARPAACITLAISDSPTGPFIPASQYDSDTYSQSSLVRYVWTKDSSGDSEGVGYTGCYNAASGSWSKGFGCIDPEFVIDIATGNLCEFTVGSRKCYAITYGSWKGGIALVYVDSLTLKPVCSFAGKSSYDGKKYAVGDVMDAPLDSISGNSGTLIAGGLGAAYEGSQVIYNSETGFYYVFVSMGDLTYEYRVGVGRSSTIDGDYLDAGGVSMNFASDSNAAGKYHAIGSKIIGAFAFEDEYGLRCPGGQSIWRDKDGRILFANHTRTNYLNTWKFVLQVHQMFFNDDGWPVLNLNDYYDEGPALSSISLSDLAGTYDVIHTLRGYATASFTSADGNSVKYCQADENETASVEISVSEDGTISGSYTGSLALASEKGHVIINLKDSDGNELGTFMGIVMEAVDWYRKGSNATRKTITFSALCSDTAAASAGEYFFGNKK